MSTERERWTIVDRRDNRPVTISGFFSRQQCEDQITDWQNRHDRGGRRDITREMLLNMEPRLVDDALPWGSPRVEEPSVASEGEPKCAECNAPATYRLGMPTPVWCESHGPASTVGGPE